MRQTWPLLWQNAGKEKAEMKSGELYGRGCGKEKGYGKIKYPKGT